MSRNTIKKILSILLIGLLLLGIAACEKTVGTGNNPETKISQEAKKDQKENETTKKDNTTAKEEQTKKSDNSSEQQNDANGSDSFFNSDSTENSAGSEANTNSGNSTSGSSSGSSTGESSQPDTQAPTEPPVPSWTINVTIDGAAYGGIFASGSYTYYYQPTAFDALVSTGLDYTGSSNYVRSINGLAEFDHGRFSGWLYSVNGVEPNVGCGSYYLDDGDSVYWHYQGDE